MQQPAPAASTSTWWYWFLAVVIGVVALLVVTIVRKGRRLPGDHVYRASRLSKGNRLFPAQVVITPASLTLYKPQWIGKLEESIHMAHIASIKIDTNVLFADISIETSGGQDPVRSYGHTKGDALELKQMIERYQSDYYKAAAPTKP